MSRRSPQGEGGPYLPTPPKSIADAAGAASVARTGGSRWIHPSYVKSRGLEQTMRSQPDRSLRSTLSPLSTLGRLPPRGWLSPLTPLPTSAPSTRARSPTACRRAHRDLVDVAILAALNPKHLAGRCPRVGGYSAIDPGEVVEDDNGAEALIDDVAAVGHIELLRERRHGARLPLRVPGGRTHAAFEPGAGRPMRHRELRVPPIIQ